MKWNCMILNQEWKDEKSKKYSDDENVVTLNSNDELIYLICRHGDCNHGGDPRTEWIAHNEAAYHYVPKKELFKMYKT